MIPTYELTGDSFIIKGKGLTFTAFLTCNCKRNDLLYFVGKLIKGHKIKVVESYDTLELKKYTPISFLT